MIVIMLSDCPPKVRGDLSKMAVRDQYWCICGKCKQQSKRGSLAAYL